MTWWQCRDHKKANLIPVATPEQFNFKRPDQWLKWKRQFEQFQPPGSTRVQTNHNCGRCGQRKQRPGDRCPAKQAICRKCNKKAHYAMCCFSKTAAASAHKVEAEDPAFLGALTNNSDISWTSNLRIAGRRI